MGDDDQQMNSGGFSKARSHIMLVLGVVAAAAIAIWLEQLDPAACRRAGVNAPPRPLAVAIRPA
jgi:hypothetical protein